MGIGYSEKDWQMLVGYQRTLLGENVDANDTVAATVIVTFLEVYTCTYPMDI